jgi:F0F1-type ATP synthase membrane subunit c/vacuolar-type H+-ATPase subunit K
MQPDRRMDERASRGMRTAVIVFAIVEALVLIPLVVYLLQR